MAESPAPRLGLSWMDAADWIAAAGPLFSEGRVDALEWSFDAEADSPPTDGSHELLEFFARRDALLGHGVSYSVLGAGDEERHDAWLEGCARAHERFPLRWVTEHFGFMGAGELRFASPLPVPMTAETVALGQARLRALALAHGGPVGLENLAFAFSAAEALEEGAFLRELVGPVDGFVLLDLHNLYCRAHNFGLPADELFESYPLELVRELHVSGGSWAESRSEPGRDVRRDTHDAAVPEAVFALVERALARCPNLEFVIYERLGETLTGTRAGTEFRADYARLEELVGGVRHVG